MTSKTLIRCAALLLLAALLLFGGAQGTRDSMAADETFEMTVTIDRPVERVWQALIRKEDVDRYYLAPLGANITAVGEPLFYGSQTQQMIVGDVTDFQPNERLSHSFSFAGEDRSAASMVTYRLASHDGQTELRLEHSGYAPDSQSYADISMGWPLILERLKSYLESQ